MAPRASWTGYLRLSLVTIPVRLYNAVSSTSKVSLNQLHKGCNLRLRQQMVCPEHGKVEKEDIVKGYEFEKDRYVVIDEADLAKIKLETTKTIDLIQFVDAGEVDSIYFDTPYYVAPDGPVAEEGFRILREAMRLANKIAIGQVVIANREHMVAIQPQDKGLVLNTLHYAEEVRNAASYFEDIKTAEVQKAQLALAEQLVNSLASSFDQSKFKDRYQESLLEVIKSKVAGSEPVIAQKAEMGKVINLMDALKQSLAQSMSQKKPPAASVKTVVRKQKKVKNA
ncbi:MAG: Ku protein [Acidobacteria bacterium]|nr:Ku protein [Acidobacteriota bacterium]MCI0628543.1 Ku protein [Acidobacteriota bacterium]